MNPPMNFANGLIQLKLLTSQVANFTFTDDEITQALTTAWQDQFVVNPVWDSSIVYQIGTWQYPVPATIDNIKEVYIKRNTDQYPEKISQDLYEIVNGQLQVANKAQLFLDNSYVFYLKGNYKLTTSDSLQTDNQINYVLANAAFILLRQLSLKAAFVFLRNDISMVDIIRAKNDMQNDVIRYRQALSREFETV